jgi:uncharacterized pyridoxamine 5'-phosphate oxidase family protein
MTLHGERAGPSDLRCAPGQAGLAGLRRVVSSAQPADRFSVSLPPMALTPEQVAFLNRNHSAAMVTVAGDGQPRAVRVGVSLVDGKLWSSGTQGRVRTKRLRSDPRCTFFVWEQGYSWLALEGEVTVLDGPDAAEQNLRLFRVMQDRPNGPLSWFGGEVDENAFLQAMAEEGRLIYELEVRRAYGI